MTADHLYFVQCGEDGPIKIGITGNPDQRFRALRTACPYPLTVLYCRGGFIDAPGYEAKLHRRYARYRLNGEWFLPSDVILGFIGQSAAMDAWEDAGCPE
jgi:hypothetical protein